MVALENEPPGLRVPGAGVPGAEFIGADLTGARFEKTQLNEAHFRMCDLSGVVMRDLSLSGASIDGCEIDGLLINGIAIAPLIEAELTRRMPARALRRSPDGAGLRAGWVALGKSWSAVYEKVAEMPSGAVDLSVAGEWSFAETLRHLVFATDAWLGAAEGKFEVAGVMPFHAWGVPFTEMTEFSGRLPADVGIDTNAAPSYHDVMDLRSDRVERVRRFLAEVTPEALEQEVEGPFWEAGERFRVVRCLWVILNEECEHLRFAERDLDLIRVGSPLVAARRVVAR